MKVLIVDDDAAMRTLLEELVEEWDYEVTTATCGQEAWKILQEKDAPQVVLSDWMMARMDGIQLCRKVKTLVNHPYVYFILLTSRKEKMDRILGLNAGADDFLAKPVDVGELRSRLLVGTRTVNFDTKIRKYATQMETLAEERARQLIHSERLATLGILSAGLAHEINNALSLVSGNIKLFHHFWDDLEGLLREFQEAGDESSSKAKFILERMPKMMAAMINGTDRLENMVKGLKGFSRKDTGKFYDCSVHDCIEQALLICDNNLKYRIQITRTLCESPPLIKGIPQQLEQVLTNLFINAADAMDPKGGELHITTDYKKDRFLIAVEDNGPGIPEDKLESIWEAFYTTKGEGKGTGLGLSISKGIIEDHGGKIIAENKAEGGARFIITLPVGGPKKSD